MNVAFSASNSGLKIEAIVNTASMSGVGAAICPRLFFQIVLHISHEPSSRQANIQSWSFGTVTGELIMGSEKITDIRSYSLNTRRLSGVHYPYDEYLNIEIPLNARQIEWIERQRAGKSFEAKLRVNLQVQVFGSSQHTLPFPFGLLENLCIQGELPIVVPDTQWREQVLPGLGYGKVIVVELPAVSLDSCAALGHSFKALENAQKQFNLGLYDEAAGSCRIALDQFFEQVPKGEGTDRTVPKLKKSWEKKLGESTYHWLGTSLSAIKEATNAVHHSPNSHFDRLGVQMILMVTTALVSFAAQQQTAS